MTRLEFSPLLLTACVATAAFPPGCGGAVGVTTDSTSSTGGSTTQEMTTTPATDPSTTETPTTGAQTSTSTTDLPTTDPSTTDTTTGTATDTTTGTTADTTTGTTADTTTDTSSSSTGTDSTTGSSVCGDGVIDGAEACDDGPGNADTAACTSACLKNTCGDGLVLAGIEACDDGGESATCDAECTVAECGDGIVNTMAGETCDAGGESAACDLDCTPAQCLDGVKNNAAGEACDDGNMVDDDVCSNLCELGGLVLGGNAFAILPPALDDMGAPYTLENKVWIAPNSAGTIILSHNGVTWPGTDYAPHFAAGGHLLVIGGSTDETYASFITEHFNATVNIVQWHRTNDCNPDWTRGAPHPITALMPATHEFIEQSISYHMVHFAAVDQPAGVTLLGEMCHNAPDDAILVTRKYPGGGTFTYMGFAVNSYEDATSQAEFLVPFLTGYLEWVDQGAP
ncbi:hypothetical protein [Nannocystis radixulma]|uniref:hypothetical protein n=1 Tax=Nannocystis radixulma TaxID=2995305 RepID=UPI00232F9024|nr:hypothetical protein [Nannocystis radixulma]